jgi:hypothetical protein
MNAKILCVVLAFVGSIACSGQRDGSLINLDSHLPAVAPTNVPIEFMLQTNGQWAWTTNVAHYWRGIWKEGTNGLRVQLNIKANITGMLVEVEVGSVIRDAGGSFSTPNGKFAKFELLSTNGIVLQPKLNEGANLIGINGLFYKPHLPVWATPSAGSLVADFPQTISTDVYPLYHQHGDLACRIGFVSNGSPAQINFFNLNDLFSITNEGDYTLTVQPILYKQRPYPNGDVLDRVDLPSVSAKIHLLPLVAN